jgi:uncharacterized protein YcfL
MKKYLLTLFLLFTLSACSSSLNQSEYRECRELAFADEAAPVETIDSLNKKCIADKKEQKQSEQKANAAIGFFCVYLRVCS